jgi:DNA-binding response OmpR family regulator
VTNVVAKRRALLAEDDGDMRGLVAEALRKEGFEVDEVDNGRQLWGMTIRPGRYDLIVTDLRLPVVDGLTVVEDLRAREPHTPILVMTAFGDANTRARAAGVGALFFDKPFRMADLRAAVQRFFGA